MIISDRPRLIADIGGTNARFALVNPDGKIYRLKVLHVADYPGIAEAMEAYLAGLTEPRPSVAALAVATPILGDRISLTNAAWAFSIEETRRHLQFERLVMVNDFTALALAVPFLKENEFRQVGGGKIRPHAAKAVLGPGTGLGVSGLVWSGNHWIPLEGEGGHVTYAPTDEREWAVVSILQRRFEHVSAERLISGMGLVNTYQAVAELEGRVAENYSPAQVVEQAFMGSDPVCQQTVDFFCRALGNVAGNLALALGAFGGVYIGGGIVQHLDEFFDLSDFRQRFEGKGRFQGYLENIPSFVITALTPALRGMVAALELKR